MISVDRGPYLSQHEVHSGVPGLIGPGLALAGRFGAFGCGVFILFHRGQWVVLEAPPADHGPDPIPAIRRLARSLGLHGDPSHLLLSHSHSDHAAAISRFARYFPNSRPMIHPSFWGDRGFKYRFRRDRFLRGAAVETRFRDGVLRLGVPQSEGFGSGGEDPGHGPARFGEPIHLFHAPKHSWQDLIIFFRGSVITGDWWLGPGDPNQSRIPHAVSAESIARLIDFSRKYHVHTIVSAHANDLRRGADFASLMAETRRWHLLKSSSRG